MTYAAPEIDHEERRRFLKVVGITGAVAAGSELAVSDLRDAVQSVGTEELATRGGAIRGDLTGRLDAQLLEAELANIAAGAERLPELAAMGTTAEDSTVYREVAAPVWAVYDHLLETGFLESAEANLPAFTEEHISATAREFVRSEPLTALLAEVGLDERELTTLVTHVAGSRHRLALWLPAKSIPEDVEFDVEHVAPLHQRALGGVALWIDELDDHLWRNEILLTQELIDRGLWDVKVMLAGAHLLAEAARDVAVGGGLTDSQLTAAVTTGTASMIIGQEDLTHDLFRITDDERAALPGGA